MSAQPDTSWEAVLTYVGTASPLAVAAQRVNQLAASADLAREHIVRDMRAQGWTWQEIGEALGVTHQAARVRFRTRGVN